MPEEQTAVFAGIQQATRPEELCAQEKSMVSDARRILTQTEPSVSESFWILPFLESQEHGNAVATRNSGNESQFHSWFLHPLDVSDPGIQDIEKVRLYGNKVDRV